MKVYIVEGFGGNIYGVYTTKEKADKVAKQATEWASMAGHRGWYGVTEYEVKE